MADDFLKALRHTSTAAVVSAATALSLLGDQMLYAVLPVSVVALGLLILTQVLPVAQAFMVFFRMLDSMGESE